MPYTFEKKKINKDALDQSEHWRDITGKLYTIEDMNPTHARNAARKVVLQFGSSSMTSPLFLALIKQAQR